MKMTRIKKVLAAVTAAAMMVTVMISSVNAEPETSVGTETSVTDTQTEQETSAGTGISDPETQESPLPLEDDDIDIKKPGENQVTGSDHEHSGSCLHDENWITLDDLIKKVKEAEENRGDNGSTEYEHSHNLKFKDVNIYLDKDYTLNGAELTDDDGVNKILMQNVSLCLNNHTLTLETPIGIMDTFVLYGGGEDGEIILGTEKAKLNVDINNSHESYPTDDVTFEFTYTDYDKFDMYGGKIKPGEARHSSYAICLQRGHWTLRDHIIDDSYQVIEQSKGCIFTMYGGEIDGFSTGIYVKGPSQSSSKIGNVTVNIKGGTVKNCSTAAARIAFESYFNMDSGTIQDSGEYAVYADGNSSVKISDGNIQNSNSYGVYAIGKSSVDMSGGTISGCATAGIYCYTGTAAMSGSAKITGCSRYAVWVSSGTFDMSGGLITENTASSSQNVVYITFSTFTMTGGEIKDNTLPDNAGNAFAVYWDNYSSFEISKKPIIIDNMLGSSGNQANVPCFYSSSPTARREKLVKIIGALDADAQIGVYHQAPSVDYTDGEIYANFKSNIEVAEYAAGITADYSDCFISDTTNLGKDDNENMTKSETTYVVFVKASGSGNIHYHTEDISGYDECHEFATDLNAYYSDLGIRGNLTLEPGSYYLTGPLHITGSLTINGGAKSGDTDKSVHLCLNGNILTADKNIIFAASDSGFIDRTFNLYTCKSDDTSIIEIIKESSSNNYGISFREGHNNEEATKTFNMYGGTIRTASDAGTSGNGVYMGYGSAQKPKCVFNMYGGKIKGFDIGVNVANGTAYTKYDNIPVNSGGAEFNMYGGEISENKTGVKVNAGSNYIGVYPFPDKDSGIWKGSIFTMSGGTITDNAIGVDLGVVYPSLSDYSPYYTFNQFNVKGSPVIDRNDTNVYIPAAQTINGETVPQLIHIIGSLNSDAKIGFTTADKPKKENGYRVEAADGNATYVNKSAAKNGYFFSDNKMYTAEDDNNYVILTADVGDLIIKVEFYGNSKELIEESSFGPCTLEILLTGKNNEALADNFDYEVYDINENSYNSGTMNFQYGSQKIYNVNKTGYIILKDIPANVKYTVKASNGYAPCLIVSDKPNGTIIAKDPKLTDDQNFANMATALVQLYYPYTNSGLTISNELMGSNISSEQSFVFRVVLKNGQYVSIDAPYTATDENGNAIVFEDNNDINEGGVCATITLTGSNSMTIHGLPSHPSGIGLIYKVTSLNDNDNSNYIVVVNDDSGATAKEGTINTSGIGPMVPFMTTRKTGTLTITKKVVDKDGNGIDDPNNTSFKFTIEADDPDGAVIENATATKGTTPDSLSFTASNGKYTAEFELKNNESIKIELPAGVKYTVTESAVGGYELYAVENEGDDSGTIVAGGSQSVTFKNKYIPKFGDLIITNTLDENISTSENFSFKVTLSESSGGTASGKFDGIYYIGDGTETVTFANGVTTAPLTITGSGSITIKGLPAGIFYTAESDGTYDTDKYTVTPVSGYTDTIPDTAAAEAKFRTTMETGRLTVSKKVQRAGSENQPIDLTEDDKKLVFTFTVSSDNGIIKEFNLKHNESVTLTMLPVGSYTVTESIDSGDSNSYTVYASVGEASGVDVSATKSVNNVEVTKDGTTVVGFTNTINYETPQTGGQEEPAPGKGDLLIKTEVNGADEGDTPIVFNFSVFKKQTNDNNDDGNESGEAAETEVSETTVSEFDEPDDSEPGETTSPESGEPDDSEPIVTTVPVFGEPDDSEFVVTTVPESGETAVPETSVVTVSESGDDNYSPNDAFNDIECIESPRSTGSEYNESAQSVQITGAGSYTISDLSLGTYIVAVPKIEGYSMQIKETGYIIDNDGNVTVEISADQTAALTFIYSKNQTSTGTETTPQETEPTTAPEPEITTAPSTESTVEQTTTSAPTVEPAPAVTTAPSTEPTVEQTATSAPTVEPAPAVTTAPADHIDESGRYTGENVAAEAGIYSDGDKLSTKTASFSGIIFTFIAAIAGTAAVMFKKRHYKK